MVKGKNVLCQYTTMEMYLPIDVMALDQLKTFFTEF